MKIQDSLEQRALYNLKIRAPSGQVDPAVEKLKRFNTILDMFTGDDDGGQSGANLSELEMLSSPVRSSPYGRILQALSAEMVKKNASDTAACLKPGAQTGPLTTDQKPEDTHGLPLKPEARLGEMAMIQQSIARAAGKYGLPESLIKGVIEAESAFNARAVSAAGAQGLMQLMPGTARELGVTDSFDIDQNIDGGAKYLKKMLDRFDGDVATALAAYNAGPGTVERYNGKVPYRETIAYVNRVLTYAQVLV